MLANKDQEIHEKNLAIEQSKHELVSVQKELKLSE